ncbi:hypothetical protein FE257_010260 [Aspergillus nanangensis]|uniref:Enoyl reductase (ER) domain-containing protein n=1 Tax=Aspergillus nanangensis TaxID=2582783 RepID=A0AAD4CJ18_ASPNN|nr:hypothetical protein FE257_010260 [Aspergillus nanangensis]
MPNETYTALLQEPDSPNPLSLGLSHAVPLRDTSTSSTDVLVRVLAVALNHCDYKFPTKIPSPGGGVGCDFCGIVERCGYAPIAVTSSTSARLPMKYGAIGTAIYTSPSCIQQIKTLAGGAPIRRALDCITTPESHAICMSALARTGGRYVALEAVPSYWATRHAVKKRMVLGYEALGARVDFGDSPYTCDADPVLYNILIRWTQEVQQALDLGLIRPHPVREIPGKWDGIIKALDMLQRGEVHGEKLVVRIAEA